MTVFIQKGDQFMTYRQATKRGRRMFDAQKQQYEREEGLVTESQEYKDWANQWILDNQVNTENNLFNLDLLRYRRALKRLEQYRLAMGRAEVTEQQETGEFDENGEPLTETVVVVQAVEPLEAFVEQPVYDDAGEQTGVESVPNPLIEKDDAERAEAQATIDATPIEVVRFAEDNA